MNLQALKRVMGTELGQIGFSDELSQILQNILNWSFLLIKSSAKLHSELSHHR